MANAQGGAARFPIGFQSTATALATRHAYQKGNKVYISFNGMHLVALEPRSDGDIGDLLQNPRRPSWASKHHRYAAFALRVLSPDDRQVKRLVPSRSNIGYTKKTHDGRDFFTLDAELSKSWRRLEGSLHTITQYVRKFSQFDPSLSEPPMPSSFRYADTYSSFEDLYQHALLAKSAFDLFIAWVVYIVTGGTDRGVILEHSAEPVNSWPEWCKEAIRNKTFEASWLHQFLFSQAFDFRSRRVGMFISTDTCAFLDDIPLFLRAGIPFTVVCTLDVADHNCLSSANLSDDEKRALRLSDSDRDAFGLGSTAKLWDGWGTSSWTQAPTDWNTGPQCNAEEARRAEILSRVHDHWLDFFWERERHNRKTYNQLSKNDINKYDSRRRSARDATPKGSVVYLWKPYEEDRTRWERVRIEYQEKIDEWDKHEAHERVFDEYSKQWDLCKPMAEGLPPPVQKCRPLSCDSEEDGEVVRIDKSKVDDVVLRPYLRNRLWLERYATPTMMTHSERADSRALQKRPPVQRRLVTSSGSPSPLRRPEPSNFSERRRRPYTRLRSPPPESGSSKHSEWRRSSRSRSRSPLRSRSSKHSEGGRSSRSRSRSPLRPSKHSEGRRSAGARSRTRSPLQPPTHFDCPSRASASVRYSSPRPGCSTGPESREVPDDPPHPPSAQYPSTPPLPPPPRNEPQKRELENPDVDMDDVVSLDDNYHETDSLQAEIADPLQPEFVEEVHPPDVEMHDQPVEHALVGPLQPAMVAPEHLDPTTPWFEPFLRYMYFRFGFTYPPVEGSDYSNIDSWKGTLSDADFLALRGKVLDEVTALDDDAVELHRHLFHFVTLLDSSVGPPAPLCDLSPTNARHVVRTRTQARVAVELAGVSQLKGAIGNKKDFFYCLRAGQAQEHWSLYVLDSTVAVECLRRDFPTTRDIVFFFLRRGTPFTLAFEAKHPVAPVTPPTHRLVRPSDFQTTPELYVEWENAAREFMQSARSRLVWKLGGLFWRLALYFVGTTLPSLSLLDATPGLVTQYVTSVAYEETLSEEEMDLFLGYYRAASGMYFISSKLDLV